MTAIDLETWLSKFADLVYSKVGEEPQDIKWLNPSPSEEEGQWNKIAEKYYPKWSPADAFNLVCWERNPILAKSLRLPKFMT